MKPFAISTVNLIFDWQRKNVNFETNTIVVFKKEAIVSLNTCPIVIVFSFDEYAVKRTNFSLPLV